MAKNPDEPLTKVTLNLNAADWDWYKDTYRTIGASAAARAVLANFRKGVQAKAEAHTGQLVVDIDIEVNEA